MEDERARARARARKKKKRRQQKMMFGIMSLVVLMVIGGIVYGVMGYQRNKKKQELLAEGINLLEEGNFDEAIGRLDEALQWSKGKIGEFETNVLLYRADAEYRLEDYSAALNTYNLLQKNDEDNAQYKKGAAQCMVKMGDYDSALELGVIDGYIYNLRALEQIAAEEYDAALEWIARGKAAGGDAMQDLSYNEAVIWENKGDYAKALELFEAYREKYGSDENVEREITFLKSRLERYEETEGTEGGLDPSAENSQAAQSNGTAALTEGEQGASGEESQINGESETSGNGAVG